MSKPEISQDPLYQLIREEKISEFNDAKSKGKNAELKGCDFKGLDLRELDADGLDFTDGYFRGADLRGIDFRKAKLQGASLADAKVSGCYFSDDFSAAEIQMSITHGTRLRPGK